MESQTTKQEPRKRILFLCTGNAARSQMAEALARLDHGDVLEPVSAGSRPAGFVHSLAIRAIEELGIDMAGARSKSSEEFQEASFDVVVTLCESAALDCPTWPKAKRLEYWPIEDPSWVSGDPELRYQKFVETRDDLRRRIAELVATLTETPASSS